MRGAGFYWVVCATGAVLSSCSNSSGTTPPPLVQQQQQTEQQLPVTVHSTVDGLGPDEVNRGDILEEGELRTAPWFQAEMPRWVWIRQKI